MRRRIALCSIVAIAIAAFFAGRVLLTDEGAQRPTPTASLRASTAAQIAQLEERVREQPQDRAALTRLTAAYVQRARESGDPSYYALADTAVKQALALDGDDVSAIIVSGGLALSRHDFGEALALGERARTLAPDVVAAYAVITDANVELGRYEEAVASAQQQADLHPDFAAYTRISYLRELHGDIDGAIAAMQEAVDAGSGVAQDAVWGRVLLGNLYLAKNDEVRAERQYRHAASILPDDPLASAGIARLAALRGDYATAERQYRAAIDRRPLPEFVIALGDLLAMQGRNAEAKQEYALVAAIEQLFAANGVDTDVELALFNADHDIDLEATYERAVAGYARRSSVYAADTAAWAAFKAGHLDEAHRYIGEALRLGTKEPRFAYHAAMIARAAGDRDAAATHVGVALAGAQALSSRDRAAAQALGAELLGTSPLARDAP